jgi:DNA replication protein DnaC
VTGSSGVGKSHIAQALGHRACLAGSKVLYVAAHDMLKQLRAARGEGTHDRRLLRFTSPDLLIIDDLGLRTLVQDEPIDLYDIIRLRYERASTIVTSNRALDELPTIFGDPLLSSAAMDRLLDDAHVIVIEGDSYRNPPPEKRPAKAKGRSRRRKEKAA